MENRRDRLLRLALVAFGIAFLLVYPLMRVWPSGWAWQPSQHEYEQMIVGIYATLGVFLRPGEAYALHEADMDLGDADITLTVHTYGAWLRPERRSGLDVLDRTPTPAAEEARA